jgi:hypothetical protein
VRLCVCGEGKRCSAVDWGRVGVALQLWLLGKTLQSAKRGGEGRERGETETHQVCPPRRPARRIRVHAQRMVHDTARGCVHQGLWPHAPARRPTPPHRRAAAQRDRAAVATATPGPAPCSDAAGATFLAAPGSGAPRPALLPALGDGVKRPQLSVNIRLETVARKHQINLRKKGRARKLPLSRLLLCDWVGVRSEQTRVVFWAAQRAWQAACDRTSSKLTLSHQQPLPSAYQPLHGFPSPPLPSPTHGMRPHLFEADVPHGRDERPDQSAVADVTVQVELDQGRDAPKRTKGGYYSNSYYLKVYIWMGVRVELDQGGDALV